MSNQTSPDPSHVADELTEREVPNYDYTADIPPIPGTTDPRDDDPTPRSDAAEWIDAMFDDPLVQVDTLVAKYTRAK